MKEKQTTCHILMIRPARFIYNAETAVNNSFQDADTNQDNVAQKASEEFENLVSTLKVNGINAMAIDDTAEPETPDSIFPNNWISTHGNGDIFLYPMFAENRRLERKKTVTDLIEKKFQVKQYHNLSHFESENIFLEGTGSMVLDRENKFAYACLSPRTDRKLLDIFCSEAGYESMVFDALDINDQPIYHTNVMMAVADQYVVICLDSVKSKEQRLMLETSFEKSNKTIIPISHDQMNHFAGNMLQVENMTGEKILLMSSQAFHSLTEPQINTLQSFNTIVHSDISTIEKNGGGSVRCMLAEIHLNQK